jgi:hypothetical protein
MVQRAAGTGQLVSWSACEQFTQTSCLRFIGALGGLPAVARAELSRELSFLSER